MIALGVGFATRCTEVQLAELVAAVRKQAAAIDARPVRWLAAPARKRPTGLLEPVARQLGLELLYIDHHTLHAWQEQTATHSALAEEHVGLPAVAEAAALAAAGHGARLLLTRRTLGPATCAAACSDKREDTP